MSWTRVRAFAVGLAAALVLCGCGGASPTPDGGGGKKTDGRVPEKGPDGGEGSDELEALDLEGEDVARLVSSSNKNIGRELFRRQCASCHGSAGGGTSSGPDLRGILSAPNNFDVYKVIDEGRDEMPAFGAKLTHRQIGDLVGFLREL